MAIADSGAEMIEIAGPHGFEFAAAVAKAAARQGKPARIMSCRQVAPC
ncbi:hypothetical protein IU459_29800 [Nocardia amamiensis]|uniref:Uncharacterized protein n=1 Tax=Nocardia amamiensis TaxID=404578 RepID=A0ABS0CYM8_9NOCA|nr:hypothetical protein [Nocardia amamiensis]MBF6301704.1 hypothetical protein [Nocardia amamiensis]